MKFYGIDSQGYLKVQQIEDTVIPAYTIADERRIVQFRDTTNNEVQYYMGTESIGAFGAGWKRIVLDDGATTYSNLVGELSTHYHPLNGGTGVSDYMIASTYTGTTNHLRTPDHYLKLSNGSIAIGGNTYGIKIEDTNTSLDTDDISLYYDPSAAVGARWQLDGGSYTTDPIATHSYVSGIISGDLSSYWTSSEIDNRFVRYTQAGDVTTNTTYNQWPKLIPETDASGPANSTLAAGRYYHTKQEGHDSFVRVTDWATNSPTNSPKYASVSSVAWTIVQRDASQNIFCNILYGTATSAQYADLAEKYTCDENLPTGTVVEVSDGVEYEVVPCLFEKSPVVVGVVSENPAHLMNSGSEGLPIALTGRVPVRIIGRVNKGDFIIASGDGVARKGEPEELCFRIGIALESDLQTEEKLVECIIK